ncbi:hypothetical protein TRVL_02649 [Trypanosoma vivax]|nr:hypothetical protein TRVL_02649 [Trypanosoma vivax]
MKGRCLVSRLLAVCVLCALALGRDAHATPAAIKDDKVGVACGITNGLKGAGMHVALEAARGADRAASALAKAESLRRLSEVVAGACEDTALEDQAKEVKKRQEPRERIAKGATDAAQETRELALDALVKITRFSGQIEGFIETLNIFRTNNVHGSTARSLTDNGSATKQRTQTTDTIEKCGAVESTELNALKERLEGITVSGKKAQLYESHTTQQQISAVKTEVTAACGLLTHTQTSGNALYLGTTGLTSGGTLSSLWHVVGKGSTSQIAIELQEQKQGQPATAAKNVAENVDVKGALAAAQEALDKLGSTDPAGLNKTLTALGEEATRTRALRTHNDSAQTTDAHWLRDAPSMCSQLKTQKEADD